MKLNIKATNIELTEAIRNYLEEKLNALDRILPAGDDSTMAQAEVGKDTKHHHTGEVFRAEVNLHFAGHQVYAVAFDQDLYAAIDQVQEETARQINSRLEKKNTLLRRGGRRLKAMLRGLVPRRFRRY